MQFQILSTIALLLLSGANARIVGFKMPKTVKAGENFESYAQATTIPTADQDVFGAWGFAPADSAGPGKLGYDLGGLVYRHQSDQNTEEWHKKQLTVPIEFQKREYVMRHMQWSIRADVSVIEEFQVTFTVGDEKSSEEVFSVPVAV